MFVLNGGKIVCQYNALGHLGEYIPTRKSEWESETRGERRRGRREIEEKNRAKRGEEIEKWVRERERGTGEIEERREGGERQKVRMSSEYNYVQG